MESLFEGPLCGIPLGKHISGDISVDQLIEFAHSLNPLQWNIPLDNKKIKVIDFIAVSASGATEKNDLFRSILLDELLGYTLNLFFKVQGLLFKRKSLREQEALEKRQGELEFDK